MNKRRIVVVVFILIVIAIVAALMLSSYGKDGSYTNLSILGNGTIDENGTVDIKLTSWEGDALENKELKVVLKDSEGNKVFEKSADTKTDGVASVDFINVSSGEYNINVTFSGDENYSSSSLSEKLVIGNVTEEVDDNSTNETNESEIDEDVGVEETYDSSDSYSSSSSYSGSNSYSPSSSSYDSSDYSESSDTYDEDGNVVEPVIDENGESSSEG
ncbi:Ig-like domain-containing protein [Methanobrevibacter sp.]|uniref:Ig-like domain-containing protein n=1 Tax=Methanobrevibacter sp. TaxID=66852 RepID=UPI0038702939